MNPTDILKTLNDDGAQLELSLRGSNLTPEHKTLIRDNRDALLSYLAGELVGACQTDKSPGLHLYGDLLHSLMVWVSRYHELRLEHPGGVILNARPEHAAHHLTASAWAVLYDETHTVLATAGTVPRRALAGKTTLETTPEVQAALDAVKSSRRNDNSDATEKVVN